MKIPRVKIYLSIKQLILACFKDAEKSRHNIENIFKDKLDKKSIIFTGMCRSAFMIVLDYLKEYFPEKLQVEEQRAYQLLFMNITGFIF